MPPLPERLVRATLDAVGQIAVGQSVSIALSKRVAEFAWIDLDQLRRRPACLRRCYGFRRWRSRRVS
jgi:hypothetical protein